MQRIIVIGSTGSGKTTLASQLAAKQGCPHVELDALNWEANWTQVSPEVMRQRAQEAVSGNTWVVDGNYSAIRDILWLRADTLVWLDYPFLTVLKQLTVRTFRRIVSRELLWGNNRESLRMLFSRDSIILWLFTTYNRRRRQYPALFARPEYAHLTVVRLASPEAKHQWLDSVKTSSHSTPKAEAVTT
jgi:adenylate kinase family enzyme